MAQRDARIEIALTLCGGWSRATDFTSPTLGRHPLAVPPACPVNDGEFNRA
jgi:hypothetical protein